jgi:hypothetical protein
MEYQEMVFQGIGSLSELQESGRHGWELVDLKLNLSSSSYIAHTAVLRRNPGGNATWGYHVFNTDAMPPSWHGHIGSCGWHSVGASFYRYTGIELYVFKRSGKWVGLDDGDIVQRLRDFGWWGPYDSRTLGEIFGLKSERSQQEGRHDGTGRAVKLWRARQYLNDAAEPESALDDVLAFREAKHVGEAVRRRAYVRRVQRRMHSDQAGMICRSGSLPSNRRSVGVRSRAVVARDGVHRDA